MSTLGRPAVAAAPSHAPHRSDEDPGSAGLALPASVRWKALVLCGALAFSGEAMSQQRGDILDCQEFANEVPSLIRDSCWIEDEEHKPACENAYRQATSEILSWCNGNVRRCDEQRRAVLDQGGMGQMVNVTWGLYGWSRTMGGPRWSTKCYYDAVSPKAGSASPGSQQPRQASQPEVRKKPTRSTVRQVQADLARLGYKPGPADGIAGRRTAAAVKRFQSDSGVAVDGRVTAALVAKLRAAVDAVEGTIDTTTPGEGASCLEGDLGGGARRKGRGPVGVDCLLPHFPLGCDRMEQRGPRSGQGAVPAGLQARWGHRLQGGRMVPERVRPPSRLGAEPVMEGVGENRRRNRNAWRCPTAGARPAIARSRSRVARTRQRKRAGWRRRLGASPSRPVTSNRGRGTKFRDCPACPELVVVPSGSFEMGSPQGEDGPD